MTSTASNTAKSRIDDAGHSINAMADDAARFADRAADDMKSAAKDSGSEFLVHASDAVSALKDAASAGIDGARETFAATGERIADNLRASAHQAGEMRSKLADVVAGSVNDVANALRQRNMGELVADVQEMARRNPGLFMAGAAVAGFAAARFLRSSSRQGDDHTGGQRGDHMADQRRAHDRTDQIYRDAARRTASSMGQPQPGDRT